MDLKNRSLVGRIEVMKPKDDYFLRTRTIVSCPPRAIFSDFKSRCGLEILLSKIWNEDPVAWPSFSNYYGAEDVESETQYVTCKSKRIVSI